MYKSNKLRTSTLNMRDDFTKPTKDMLAKRVGYLCSKPDCRIHTIGPNENPEKATSIGVAAHITAASKGGARYNHLLSSAERKHINNGIWLCSNDAKLIDVDEERFSPKILQKWKQDAENEMRIALEARHKIEKPEINKPFIEADLIYCIKSHQNVSFKPEYNSKIGRNLVFKDNLPILFYKLEWSYSFVFHNNSSFPAYNINLKEVGNIKFSQITKVPKINNIPPFQSIDINASYSYVIKDTCDVAGEYIKEKIPNKLEGLTLKINYQDDNRNCHETHLKIVNQEIVNEKI